MNWDKWMVPIAGGVVGIAATLALLTTWHTMSPEEREDASYKAQGAVPPNRELLSRVVHTCAEVQQEANEMMQTTAELRKVIGDVIALQCKTWVPPTPPKCDEGKVAVLVDSGFGYPGWRCEEIK